MTENPSLLQVLHVVAEERSGTTKTAQIKFRAPNYLHALIEEASKRGGWGASEEIRRRLENSYLAEIQAVNNETYRFVEAIKIVARSIEEPIGKWFESRFAFDTFRAAVLAIIDLHRPPGALIRPSNRIADIYLGIDGNPESAGRMFAGAAAVAAGIPMPGGPKPTPNEGR
jgi:hypothetical protein